jgi:hypothetical protein
MSNGKWAMQNEQCKMSNGKWAMQNEQWKGMREKQERT